MYWGDVLGAAPVSCCRSPSLLGLFCFLVGLVVIALHFIQPDLLKAFFDLAEDEEDDEGILGEVYINPYFHQTQTLSSQPDFKLTIKNS